MAAAKRRTVLVDTRPTEQVVLECHDLCSLILSYVPFRERLYTMSRLSRAFRARVRTAPLAWSGTIDLSFLTRLPDDLGWLAASRNALLVLPKTVKQHEVARALESGTNVSVAHALRRAPAQTERAHAQRMKLALSDAIFPLWDSRRRHSARHAHLEGRLVSAFALQNTDAGTLRFLPHSLTFLDMYNLSFTISAEVVRNLPNLRSLRMYSITADDAHALTNMTQLRSLDMGMIARRPMSVEIIRALPKGIQSLTIMCAGNDELVAIGQHLPRLRHLDVYTDQRDARSFTETIVSLRPLAGLRALRTLRMHICGFARDGFDALPNTITDLSVNYVTESQLEDVLRTLPLVRLCLVRCKRTLKALRPLPTLRHLSLKYCSVKQDEREWIQHMLPDLTTLTIS